MTPAILPTTCYVGEVAHWLAFGRVPEVYTPTIDDTGGPSEREDREAFLERGGPIAWDYYGFQINEFVFSGVGPGDYDRYFRAKDSGWGHATGDEHRAEMEKQFVLIYGANQVG